MTSVSFPTDRRQIRARAWTLALVVCGFAGGVVYLAAGHSIEEMTSHRGTGNVAFIALVLGGPLAIHAACGLMTDLGALPRIVVRPTAEGVALIPLGSAFSGAKLHVSRGALVAVGALANRREGAATPGYRVALTLASGGESVRAVVVTGTPECAAQWMVDALRGAGVDAVVGEPRVNAYGQPPVAA